jgi:hypothetical protein
MLKNKTLEMGGIYRKDFVKYFLAIGGKTEDQETFKGSYWEVLVGSETLTMHGSLRIQHIVITINVEEEKFDEFIAKFNLTFIRAGG